MLSFYKVGGPNQLHVHSLRRCFKRNLCSPCASKHNSGEKIKKDLLFQKKNKRKAEGKSIATAINTLNTDVTTSKLTGSWRVVTDVWLKMSMTVIFMFSLV